MDRYVIQFPDQRLAAMCDRVSDFDLARDIVARMISIAHKIRSEIYQYPRGFEMAALQIGEPYRIIILQSDYHKDVSQIETTVMVNSEILHASGEFYNWEDCLSVKDMRAFVKRFGQVQVRYQDLQGKPHERVFQGNIACDIQHGVDHLNGVLFFERDMKFLIPWSVYRPLKEQGFGILNAYVVTAYREFDPNQYFGQEEMKRLGLIHPRQCLRLSDKLS
jgi:peptide deformylase